MNQCCGLFGRIFGHLMSSHLVEEIPPCTDGLKITADYAAVLEIVNRLTKRRYVVRCKRCGVAVEGEFL